MKMTIRIFAGMLFAVCCWGQSVGAQGIPNDWSHHHLIFSKPSTQWQKRALQHNPRYRMQQSWRSNNVFTSEAFSQALDAKALRLATLRTLLFPQSAKPVPNAKTKSPLHRDWAFTLGGSGSTVGAEMYPAKFTFSISGTPSCIGDFAVFNTGLAGSTQASILAYNNLYAGSSPGCGSSRTQPATLTNGSAAITGSGSNHFTTTDLGALITGAGIPADTIIIAVNVGANAHNATMSKNFTGTTGSVTITVTPAPTVVWAYNTGGTVKTSPVLSIDGSQVAFVHSGVSGTTAASLVLLKWASSITATSASQSVTLPQTLTPVSAASYPTCTAPCMTTLIFSGGTSASDGNSAPFYDYDTDALYVGDDNGSLHKFTPVFNGTGGNNPTEITTSGWPITVHSGTALSSPVYDLNSGTSTGSGNIFLGDASGQLSYVRETTSSSTASLGGVCLSGSPPCLGAPLLSLGGKIVDGPLVDGSTHKVFWFDTITSGSSPTLEDEVVQTDTALLNQVSLGFPNGSSTITTGNMHAGTFDNTYYNTPGTGFLYFCANTTSSSNRPSLYRVGFKSSPTSGTMNGSTNAGPLTLVSSDASNECSPITEILNGTTDRIFAGVENSGSLTGCTGACLYSFNVTPTTGTATVNSQPADSDTITAGGVTYTWHTSCSSGTCIVRSATTTTDATNLAAAIDGTCSSSSQCIVPSANINATATAAGSVTTITNVSGGGLALSQSTSAHITLSTSSIATSFPTNSAAALTAAGGTSGIIVDNVSSTTGASQVYFSNLSGQTCTTDPNGSTGCAVQASQALLQ